MKNIILVLALIFISNIQSQENNRNDLIGKIMELGNYESISINGPFQVQLYSGKEGKIELTGNNTATELIEIFIHNDELIIRPIERN